LGDVGAAAQPANSAQRGNADTIEPAVLERI
jgi:hypothetical protein